MARSVVAARGADLALLSPGAPYPREFRGASGAVPPSLLKELSAQPAGSVAATDAGLATQLESALGRPVPIAELTELRSARADWSAVERPGERAAFLDRGRRTLEAALRTPEEVLITLAREEARLERAVGREARAAESFVDVGEPAISDYARRWTGVRSTLGAHLAELGVSVEAQARRVVPNLAALVGERTAARLLAEAGGLAALARLRAPRLQLLGSRRRPSPERGPRYGLLFRADGTADVPPGRRGAYARSLAALAAIAARADASTGAAIAEGLIARRDRRIAELRARRR